MSESPKNWKYANVGKACETVKGKKPSNSGSRSNQRTMPYVNIKAFESGVPEEFAEPGDYPTCSADDVLIVWDGARAGLVGHGVSGYIGSTLARISCDSLDNSYLLYFLRSKYGEINSRAKGVGIPHVDPQVLKALEMPIPPRLEQRRIVAEIEKQFSRLEEGVGALRRLQANLKRYRAAVLKAACEGKLVPTEAELAKSKKRKFETGEELLARTLAERRQNWKGRSQYKEPPVPDTSVKGNILEGWTVCSIAQVAECLDGRRKPINKAERAKRHGEIPYYGANGQVGWIDKYIFDEPLVLVVEDETFTGRTQAFSYMIQGKTWVNNHAHVLRATQAVLATYLNYSLAFYPFIARTTGSTGRRKLTQKALMAAPYLLPPLAEQKRIVLEIERRLSVVEEMEATVEANLQRATRLRQSILQKAFSGNLCSGTEGCDGSGQPIGAASDITHSLSGGYGRNKKCLR